VSVTLAGANAARAAEPAEAMNACGCREGSAGLCYCDRNAKCGCPGECEPKGCEEKRDKQLDREIELETKKAEGAAQKKTPVDSYEGGAPPPARPTVAPKGKSQTPPTHRMTAAERSALKRLLDVYLAEHPDAREKQHW
jgi:hypothetical protein